jgi:CDP-diacylglycerol--glycerol-3-phosphate 3-phosphatidyltransferase
MSDGAISPGAHAPVPGPGGTASHATTFGPSAMLTPANAITVLRLLATPVVIALIVLWGASWTTFVLGGLLAASDGIDGWLARKQGTTRSGAFLDPLADKVVVLWLPVVIIAVREVAMSVYRAVVGRRGVSVPARTTAKVKTLLQDVAIGMCLAPPLATHQTVLATAIWVATAMTVFTGGQYYLDGRRVARAGRGGAADGSSPAV